MIRRLYRKYRFQILFALILVILENAAYIAEPYVFGQAIDGLREASRIEEEVDSSLTNIQMRQIADSVRAHLLDSLKVADSLRKIDTLTTPELNEESSIPPQEEVKQENNRSIFFTTLWQRQSVIKDTIAPDDDGLSPAALDSLRKIVATHDSARSHAAKKKLATAKREGVRDSLRKHYKEQAPQEAKGKKETSKPIAFYLPREVGPFLPPLIPWVLLFIIHSAIGGFRRIYDTKLYTKMFAHLSSDVVARQLAQGEDLSKVAARSSMAWHNIEFFQYSLPEFLEQLIGVGGAVIALGIFDWRLTVVGGTLIILVALGSKYYIRAVQALQVAIHDRYEDEYNVFGTHDPKQIRQYYSDISDLEIEQSKRSTASYGVLRFFLLIMFLTTLYISIDLDRFSIGSLYSIVAYVWSFVTATEYIPYLSEKWVALKDSSRRIGVSGTDEIA